MANQASIPQQDVHLYAAVGRSITHYEVDTLACTLTRKGTVEAPENVQYAWPHPSLPFLYTASSDGGHSVAGKSHHLTAFQINRLTGELFPCQSSVALRSRPVHMTLDATGSYALVAYHFPARASVHQILSDGSVGNEVPQSAALDTGIYPHQILVAPSNNIAVIVARGNDAKPGKPEDPGALKFLRLHKGELTNVRTIAPNEGYGFGPRHIDFDPQQRWVFAALERQNKLYVFRMNGDDPVSSPFYVSETLSAPKNAIKNQLAGALRIHPNGRFLYVINRASGTVNADGERVLDEGENNIAVFRIDQQTGEPTLIQNEDTRGINTRTFAIAPGGSMLVAANSSPITEIAGKVRRNLPACLSTYRIGDDGRLTFAHRYPVDTGEERLFWSGMLQLH